MDVVARTSTSRQFKNRVKLLVDGRFTSAPVNYGMWGEQVIANQLLEGRHYPVGMVSACKTGGVGSGLDEAVIAAEIATSEIGDAEGLERVSWLAPAPGDQLRATPASFVPALWKGAPSLLLTQRGGAPSWRIPAANGMCSPPIPGRPAPLTQ